VKKLFLLLCVTSLSYPLFFRNKETESLFTALFRAPLGSYGYIFNTTISDGPNGQILNPNQAISFSSSSNLVGITHANKNTNIIIVAPGTYFVCFTVAALQVNQFALFLNGTIIPNTNYGTGAGFTQNTGFAIIQTTTPNAILTVVNHTPFGTTLGQTAQTSLSYNPYTGGSETNTINAAVFIEQLA
jgi:hypothetical protein